MKDRGSLTAGGGVARRFFLERSARAGASALPWGPLPSACFPLASFFALALLWGAALADPLDFAGWGGWSASSTASSMALETTGATLLRPRGGVVGVMGQPVSTFGAAFLAVFLALEDFFAAFLAARASSAAFAGGDSGSFLDLASAVAARLFGPRVGPRGVKIQPTPGTGLPPTKRPSSKSHGCSPWNSWKESLERTTAPVRSAMRKTKASPRPMAPAGGGIISPVRLGSGT